MSLPRLVARQSNSGVLASQRLASRQAEQSTVNPPRIRIRLPVAHVQGDNVQCSSPRTQYTPITSDAYDVYVYALSHRRTWTTRRIASPFRVHPPHQPVQLQQLKPERRSRPRRARESTCSVPRPPPGFKLQASSSMSNNQPTGLDSGGAARRPSAGQRAGKTQA